MSNPRDVLLVEDNKINQLVARKVLEKAGLSVDVAISADEAIDRLREFRYRLVLMDVQMPGTDGAEATRLIRSGEVSVLDPAVPIIAMTAYTSEEDKKRFEASGMSDFLAKPLDVDELIDLVHIYTNEATETPPALNAQELVARLGNDHELAEEIVDAFASEVGNRIRQLATSVDTDEWEDVRTTGHYIAGAAGNVSAEELRAFGREIETAAADRNVARVRELLGTADGLVERFRVAASENGYLR